MADTALASPSLRPSSSCPSSLCDTCPHDARACLAEGWRTVDGTGGTFRLCFACPHLDLTLEAAHDGPGRWHVVDHRLAPGGVDVARGRSPRSSVMYHAADAFHELGYFRSLPREAVAASMRAAYVERFASAPAVSRSR